MLHNACSPCVSTLLAADSQSLTLLIQASSFSSLLNLGLCWFLLSAVQYALVVLILCCVAVLLCREYGALGEWLYGSIRSYIKIENYSYVWKNNNKAKRYLLHKISLVWYQYHGHRKLACFISISCVHGNLWICGDDNFLMFCSMYTQCSMNHHCDCHIRMYLIE